MCRLKEQSQHSDFDGAIENDVPNKYVTADANTIHLEALRRVNYMDRVLADPDTEKLDRGNPVEPNRILMNQAKIEEMISENDKNIAAVINAPPDRDYSAADQNRWCFWAMMQAKYPEAIRIQDMLISRPPVEGETGPRRMIMQWSEA